MNHFMIKPSNNDTKSLVIQLLYTIWNVSVSILYIYTDYWFNHESPKQILKNVYAGDFLEPVQNIEFKKCISLIQGFWA